MGLSLRGESKPKNNYWFFVVVNGAFFFLFFFNYSEVFIRLLSYAYEKGSFPDMISADIAFLYCPLGSVNAEWKE